VATNIDRKSIEVSYKIPNIKNNFSELLNKGILIQKENEEKIFEFSFQPIQNALIPLTDEKCHENALQYYKRKTLRYGIVLDDKIEVLFHKAKINPLRN